MSRLLDRLGNPHRRYWRALVPAFAFLLAAPATGAQAQFVGYGMPGYGYGYGYPGFGLGYPAYGNMGYGFGGGFPAFPPGAYYGGPAITVAAPYAPFGVAYGGTGPGAYNPLFGLGLTPLGVNSALAERSLLGRGVSGIAPGTYRITIPVPSTATTTTTTLTPVPSTGIAAPAVRP